MATQRAHNWFRANRTIWFSEIKRHDLISNVQASRLQLLKPIRRDSLRSHQQKLWVFQNLQFKDMRRPRTGSQESLIKLPCSYPVISAYPNTIYALVTFTHGEVRSQQKPQPRVEDSPIPNTVSQSPPSPSGGKPSLDQLLKVYNVLQHSLPRFFTKSLDYTIFSKDVILNNNILNKTFIGLPRLLQQAAFLRISGHFKYAYVKLDLISMSQDPLEGRITVRCKVVGISGFRVLLKFWKFKLWKYQEMKQQQEEVWIDALSHFDVGSDGRVFRITVDNLEEDKERLNLVKSPKSPIAVKLGLVAALFPRSEFGEMICCGSSLLQTTPNTTGRKSFPVSISE